MKRIIAILMCTLCMLFLASCNDGKCDTCGEEAVENDEAISGVKGEYCLTHLTEEMGKAVGEALGALTE